MALNCARILGKQEPLTTNECKYLPYGIDIINAMVVGLGRELPRGGRVETPASSDVPDFLLLAGMKALRSDDRTRVYDPFMELRETLVDLVNGTEVSPERRDAAARFFSETGSYISGYES